MTTPDELLKMAERLEAVEAWYAETHSHEDGTQHGIDTTPLAAAALLRMLAEEMEWQDMETAPRDGTWVLLTGGDIDYGWDGKTKPEVVAGSFSRYCDGQEVWHFAVYDSGYYGEYERPTKWMPLPKGEA